MKEYMIDEHFFANLKTPFLLIKNKASTNEFINLSLFLGERPIAEDELRSHQSFFGGLTFEGIPNFFEIKSCSQVTLLNKPHGTNFQSESLKINSITEIEDYDQFTQMIDASKMEFENAPELLKFILHRKVQIRFNQVLTLSTLLELIPPQDMTHDFFIFYDGNEVQISFTPETLLEMEQNTLRTMALAGTSSRGKNEEEDKRLENELLADSKNLTEQEVVTNSIKNTLSPFCHNLKIENKTIKKLQHVQHLMNLITASLNENVSFIDILRNLHPTPALGGEPKEMALKSIQKIEQRPRRYYGGAIGYFNQERARFLVNIRNISFVHGENSLYVYGGAGILKNSDSMTEWHETRNKMKTFLTYFNSNTL